MARKRKDTVSEDKATSQTEAKPVELTERAPEVKAEVQKTVQVEAPKVVVEEKVAEKPAYRKTRRGGCGKKKAAATEIIPDEPIKPNAEQQEMLDKWTARIEALRAADARAQRSEIDLIASEMDDALQMFKVRQTRTLRSAVLARDIENSPLVDQEMLAQMKKDYEAAVAWENFQAFRTAVFAIKAQCDAHKEMLVAIRDTEQKNLIIKKVAQAKGVSVEDLVGADIQTRNLDLPYEIMSVMFAPYNFCRKFQNEFKVVIEAQGGKGRGKGEGSLRGVALTGVLTDLDACIQKLKKLDFGGRKTVQFESRDVNAILPRGGSEKAELEKRFQVYINIQAGAITVLGSKENVEQTFAHFDELKAAAELARKSETEDVEIPSEMAKCLLRSSGRRTINKIESETSCVIRFKTDGPVSVATVKGKTDKIKVAVEKLRAAVDALVSLPVEATKADVDKLMGRNRDLKELASAFRTLRDSSFPVILPNSAGFSVVGESEEECQVTVDGLKELILQCSYAYKEVTLQKDQVRIFQNESRLRLSVVQVKSDCTVRMFRNKITLNGPQEKVDKAEQMIHDIIEKEGAVKTLTIQEGTVNALLGNLGARIKQIQQAHTVQMKLDKKTLQLTIIGGKDGVEAAAVDVAKLEKDGYVTKMVRVEKAAHIRMVIGRKGATIRAIKEKTGVQIDVIDETQSFKLVGSTSAVAKAKKEIADIVAKDSKENVPENVEDVSSLEKSPVIKAKKPRERKEKINIKSEDLFPTLGDKSQASASCVKEEETADTEVSKVWDAQEAVSSVGA